MLTSKFANSDMEPYFYKMNLSKESKDKLRSALHEELLFLEEQVKRIKNDIDALDLSDGITIQSKAFQSIINPGKTFNEIIVDILRDGVPRTSRDLLKEYSKIKQKLYSIGDFSARLSPLTKSKKQIMVHKIDNAKIDVKHWYGLKEWFEGDILKDEFLKKIKAQ